MRFYGAPLLYLNDALILKMSIGRGSLPVQKLLRAAVALFAGFAQN